MSAAIFRNIPGFRLSFAFIILLSIVQSVLNAVSVTALIPLGSAVVGSDTSTLQWPLSELGSITSIGLPNLFFALAGILFLKVFVALLASVLTNHVKRRIWQRWAHKLLQWQLYMPYRNWVHQDSGELINLSTRELTQASSFLAGYVSMLTQLFSSLAMAVAIVLVDWRLIAAAALLGVLSYLAVLRPLNKLAQTIGHQGVAFSRAVATLISETISGVRDIRLMNAERQRLNEVDKSVDRVTKNDFYGSILQDIPTNGLELVLALLLALMGAYFAANSDTEGLMEQLPVMIFFLVSMFRLTSYAAQLSSLQVKTVKRFPSFMVVVAATEKASGMVPSARSEDDVKTTSSGWRAERGFELKNLSFAHDKKSVLNMVDLNLPVGSVTYLRGPSGSGKSSIADVLARLYEPTPGTVFVDGKDAASVDIGSWRALVGYVSQDPVLFSGTLRDNMRLGSPDASADEMKSALSAAGADELLGRSGDGLDVMLAERGRNISGGQKCRIAIARALLKSPSLLILDESMGGLELGMEAEIVAQLKAIKTLGVLVISHRKPPEDIADQQVVLDRGRLKVELPLSSGHPTAALQ